MTQQNGARMPTRQRAEIGHFAFVIDNGELYESSDEADRPPTLIVRCQSCRQMFASDYEEKECGRCVGRRELPTAQP